MIDWARIFNSKEYADVTYQAATQVSIGDVMMLVSEGPHMTVTSFADTGGSCLDVTCVWFDGDDGICTAIFPLVCLVKVIPELQEQAPTRTNSVIQLAPRPEK